MSRETKRALRRERKRGERAGIGLLLGTLAAIALLLLLLVFLTH